ncbi:MAG: hypothetical protein AAGM22_21815 [Acidobacteriota bacterium]
MPTSYRRRASAGRRRWRSAAIAFCLVPAASTAFAQVEARAQVELEPVTSWELASSDRAARVAELDGSFGHLRGVVGPPATSRIVRDLPSLWSVPLDDLSNPYGPSASYRLFTHSGRTDALESDRGDHISARVEALPTLRDSRSSAMEGGARLVLDVGQTRRAGIYRGLLMITLTNP